MKFYRSIWHGIFVSLCICIAPGIASAIDYLKDIKPLLKQRCTSCHGAVQQMGDLRLDAGALLPSDLHAHLLERITAQDEEERMPPEGAPLTEGQIALLQAWLAAGAPYPSDEVVPLKPAEHWAFQPIQRPPLPHSPHPHPLDAWLYGDRPVDPRASPGKLLRRLYLDVVGIPPTIDEQDRYLGSEQLSQQGTNRDETLALIEGLLSRPEYGERWGRHWLDVVRYADSNGYERDAEKPFVWRYRDYVIDSLNRDKPFDRFLIEQLAGDELPEATLETHIATGFLRLGHWDDEPADPLNDRFDQLDDIVATTSQAFLGLTIACARCHDHKFEPLSSRDYYSLVAIFNPLQRPQEGRTELTLTIADTPVYVWREPSGIPPETHILQRGSAERPGEAVPPAVPAILVSHQPEFPPPGENSTLRRLAFAQWMADTANPLTARVIVNRVWQQHFGEGLVATANDFGLMGQPPSHPELLDWLSHWFMHDAHWSLKKLHRLILSSRAWQAEKTAASIIRYRRLEIEALRDSILAVSGQLNPKRFGPAFRPTIPAAAIEANTDQSKVWEASDEAEGSRRTIYAFIKRGLIVPMFETFDLADTVSSCPQRQVTTVAPQALTLFNGDFVRRQSVSFAARLQREAGDDMQEQLKLAYRLALCRTPSDDELDTLRAFMAEQSLVELCRVLLNLNEFAYPE